MVFFQNVICLVVLMNLNIGYLSVITSKVIIPNQEADVENPSQLFQQGFRFILQNISLAGVGFVQYWGKYLEAVKINTSKISNIVSQVDTCPETFDPICLSMYWPDLATGAKYLHKKTEILLSVR
jgi:hypothetical protein